jgi:ectoine hydroxylase-related dioxygenase (phytanoyl-CoA dioxygenase family)
MFDPPDVVTVWIALDTMDDEIGPLQYVHGSHLWNRHSKNTQSYIVGSTNQFFDNQRGGRDLLYAAAHAAQVIPAPDINQSNDISSCLNIVSLAGLPAGAMSIHHGCTWHGSGPNKSKNRPRRGLGIHFVPANAQFTAEAIHSRLWKKYVLPQNHTDLNSVNDVAQLNLHVPDESFPISWVPSQCTDDRELDRRGCQSAPK